MLLWINLKTGILPHNVAIAPFRDSNPTEGENVSRADRGAATGSAKVQALPILAKKGSRSRAENTPSYLVSAFSVYFHAFGWFGRARNDPSD